MIQMDKTSFSGTYIDLFSGCGGLSLGLGNAGWKGLFAVEKDPMAFATFKHNLIDSKHSHFDWPSWLPKEATTIQDLFVNYKSQLIALKGKIDLIAGGPPCQGFSLAGKRNVDDPRNQLSNQYIEMVRLVTPKYLILENVRGFNSSFKNKKGEEPKLPQSKIVKAQLEELGYQIHTGVLTCETFGVPQKRTRFIMIGVRQDLALDQKKPFDLLQELRDPFLTSKGLPLTPVKVKDAIGDLEIANNTLAHHSGDLVKGFKKVDYKVPNKLSAYQTLMRKSYGKKAPNGLRLARHRPETIEKFKKIQKICRPGLGLTDEQKLEMGTKKQVVSVLDPNQPSRTLTTLPDDVIHYSEPRILTVRENARIQSFPDSFEFKGKYTTGGMRRTQECPRYTQVGNAVPPLLGEILGLMINEF